MKTLALFAALGGVVLLAGAPALAQHDHGHGAKAAPQSTQSRAELSDGEVRRVDKAKGTVLIKHGEIKNLGMTPMTMGFKLQDPKMAEGLNPGDKIKFAAIQKGDDLIVTQLIKVQ